MAKSIVWEDEARVARDEIYPGVFRRLLWESESGRKALILDIEPGGKFTELDIHEPGDEDLYVVEGIFNDGERDYPAGSFIHNPRGSSHVPQSQKGCKLFVFFPEG
ncbi:MAG: cupin domain-containing protein [Cyclobacteriaceae bacterium]